MDKEKRGNGIRSKNEKKIETEKHVAEEISEKDLDKIVGANPGLYIHLNY